MDEFKDNPFRYAEAKRQLFHWIDTSLISEAYAPVCLLHVSYHRTKEPVPFAKRKGLFPHTLKKGEKWSKGEFPCAWFHLTGKVPSGTDLEHLYLSFVMGGEALLYDKEGHPLKGFSNGSLGFSGPLNFRLKRHYPLKDLVEDGKVDLWLDGGDNSAYQYEECPGILRDASLVLQNPETCEVLSQVEVLMDYFVNAPMDAEHYDDIYQGLCQVRDLYLYHWPDRYEKAMDILRPLLRQTSTSKFQIYAVGHSHLDLGWLWPIRETKRKAVRTISNALYLLDRDPTFTYSISQAQQVAWIEEEAPELFAKLQAYVQAGRIEILGGGWVEHDLNNIGEEALMRQMLYGQKYWLEHLGHYVEIKWLPDSFGYSAALPQLLRLSGQKYMLANKLTWCLFTNFPYHTFEWKGIDGSSLITHIQLDHDYNSRATYSNFAFAESNISPNEGKSEGIIAYGIGDGGGGPGDYHIQALIRQAKIPYFPKIELGTAKEFFHDIDGQKLPIYQGELYLEQHRGTNTSQSENKQNNRHFEEKMKALEYLYCAKDDQSEKENFDALWKEAMLYQFHDCLPGSSIKRVYDETDIAYSAMLMKLDQLADKYGYAFQPQSGRVAVNHLNESVRRFVRGDEGYFLLNGKAGEAMMPKFEKQLRAIKSSVIETDALRIEINQNTGSFGKIISKNSGKTLLNEANRLRVYIDQGDAWNIPWDFRHQPEQYLELASQIQTEYEDFYEIRNVYRYQESRLLETIIIDKYSPYIEFQHDMNWKQLKRMIRAEFVPTEYSTISHAQIQFGYLDRSTENDTEHHQAQYECPSQKYIDVSSINQGVCVMNCSKGGYFAKDGIISLDLLRSTNYPCVDGDLKPTKYAYALYPHDGGFNPVKDANLAMGLNASFLYGDGFEVPTSDSDQIEISCFKPAYDQNGYILHMYEKSGQKGSVVLRLPAGRLRLPRRWHENSRRNEPSRRFDKTCSPRKNRLRAFPNSLLQNQEIVISKKHLKFMKPRCFLPYEKRVKLWSLLKR